MPRPLFALTLGLMGGIALGRAGAAAALFALLAALLLAGVAALGGGSCALWRRRGTPAGPGAGGCFSGSGGAALAARALLWGALGLVLGFQLAWLHYHARPPQHLARLAGERARRVVLVGRLLQPPQHCRVPSPPLAWTSLLLRAVRLEHGAEAREVQGVVRAFVWRSGPQLALLHYGDLVRLSGDLERPRRPTNPGQFDWRAYCADRGVHAVLSVPRWGACEVLERGGGSPVWRWAHRARAWLWERLRAAVPDEQAAALLGSVLLGVREELDGAVREAFVASGTVHLLAISGLHLALLAGLVGLVLRRGLRLGPRACALAIMGFALGYAVLTGGRPPVVRAAVMLLALLVARLLARERSAVDALALAALVILLAEPGCLFSTGFQLSFAAVLGLLWLGQPLVQRWQRWLPPVGARASRRRRWALLGLARGGALAIGSAAAWLATAPLVLGAFHLLSPYAVLANLLVGGLFTLVLAVGLVALVLAPLGGWLAAAAGGAAGGLAAALERAVGWLASWPGSAIYLPRLAPWQLGVCYAGLAAAAWALARAPDGAVPGRHRRARALALWGGLVLAVLALVPPGPEPVPAGSMRLTVLDLGHGAAAVLETPGGVALFDCGSRRLRPGERYIVPALWARGHRRVDHLFLSHADHDHTSGLQELLARMELGRVYVGAGFARARSGRRLLAQLAAAGVPVRTLRPGERVGLGGGVLAEVLAPPAGLPVPAPAQALLSAPAAGSPLAGQNDASLVVRVVGPGGRVLLPGDIEEGGTARLLELAAADPGRLQAEVLLVPHHGGPNRLSGALARAVRPQLVLVSAPEGHARPEVVCAYEDAGALLVETARGGAISVAFGPQGLRYRSYLDEGGSAPAAGGPPRAGRP
ncbi:MAG: DNA internalization-related competence protein ComEC/Rec2 [Planctomycetota bacterium]|nr:MAG: DNA internalization-related competence protein ComEC/Rec2 [Planctomycetota bacterium]